VQVPEPQNALAPEDMTDTTLRQIVHLSIGGSTIRVHLSNAFGITALRLTSVHVARPVSPAASEIDPATDRALTFNGSAEVVIPPGAQYLSDPVAFPAAAMSDIAISLYIDEAPARETGHPGSRATTYIAKGNVVSARGLSDAKTIEHWYIISGVDVVAAPGAFSVVTLGDSITDGHAATTNGNDRWTDALVRKLQASPATRNIAVLNHGIGGNHLLIDGLGPNVLARFDRDVLAQAGVRYLIVFEGINDLGGIARLGEVPPDQHALVVKEIISAYEQIIARAHAAGITVIGATILPDGGSGYYHPGPQEDQDRHEVNDWIRAPGHFDAVVDLEKLLEDPSNPNRLLPAYDCGDHLHPSPAGYKVIGEAFSVSLFK
jgi:lysophospholipase L1-like esterase